MINFDDYLNIGLIQTCIPNKLAWGNSFLMSDIAQKKAWLDIKSGFHNFINHESTFPNIVLIPELSIPLCYISNLKQISYSSGKDVLIIGGLDFVEFEKNSVHNKAIIIIPEHWLDPSRKSYRAVIYPFGKQFFSNKEQNHIRDHKKELFPMPLPYIIQTNVFGNFGIVICSDIYDIDRYSIYRGRIQHLLIIAYNKDKRTFFHIANSLSRLLLCNVVICNTGFFGDSLSISPYYDSFKRTIFRLDGSSLSNSQVFKLPVKSLIYAQYKNSKDFKSIPPGFKLISPDPHSLQDEVTSIT